MIPRVLHRIWLGSDPLPEVFRHYGETWRRHHPDWEQRLWTDANVGELALPDAFRCARDNVERSDVLRLELLRALGGVYVDTDVECRRPIDPLLDGVRAFAAYQQPGSDIVNNGVMGAVPHHPAFELAVSEIGRSVGQGGVFDSTGPHFLTPILTADADVVIFGRELFHPYHPTERHRSGEEFPEAYAVHHWSGAWKTREWYEAQKERSRARTRRLQDRVDKLKRRRQKLRAELSETELRVEELERRLSAIEGTRWWRLRRRLGSVARRVRA